MYIISDIYIYIYIYIFIYISEYINSGINLDNNKYNQTLPHIYVMTKWMANNYFLS